LNATSTIEWTDATWNPVTGCTKVSPGCAHCYALTMGFRLRGMALKAIDEGRDPGRMRHYIDAIDDQGRWTGKLIPTPEALEDPLRWASSKTVFVNSMSDLFHEDIPTEFIARVAQVMERTPWHTYQVLTKRSERLRELLSGDLSRAARQSHIWWGVSVENCKHGLPRIDDLRRTPAAVRFLSIEPLLEDLGNLDLRGIHWVIVGGESGPRARPMEEAWVLKIRRQCRAANVRFFFKQWGGVHKSEAGRLLRGRTYDEMPARPAVPVGSREHRAQLIRELCGQPGEMLGELTESSG